MSELSERLRFDAVRCEMQFSKGIASNIEEAAQRIEELEAENVRRGQLVIGLTESKRILEYCMGELRARAEQAERERDAANSAHRAMAKQLADTGRKLEEAVELLRPLARLEVPKRPQGNAGAYSIRHSEIEAARQFVQAQEGMK